MASTDERPIVLHLGDDIKWNHDLYRELQSRFRIVRSHSMPRGQFKQALSTNEFGDFVAMYRPFWATGGEMGNWDDELISLLPHSCKIFASAGAGFDWVDIQRLAEKGIIYCNSAAACTESAADAAIYMIIGTFRGFTRSSLAARSLDPAMFVDTSQTLPRITYNPNGHILGIIGLGRIGLRVAQKAHASFGLKIIYNDIVRASSAVEESIGAEYYADIKEMLQLSDCVVLTMPYTGKIVLNSSHFLAMKMGSRFVNVARGKIIDEDGLIAALESGHLSAAGLDVHFNEPHVNSKLAKMWNVELHCHTAGGSVDSHIGFERLGIENILSFFKTGSAISPVNMHLITPKS